MKRIKLEITALSPLAIAQKKPGSVSEVVDHIPGSVIRGAIASQILQQSGQQFTDLSQNGGDFQALFLEDNAAIFQNGYPGVGKKEDISQVVDTDVMVLPTTAVSSKTDSGFLPKGNGVFDTLIDRFCAENFNFPYEPSCPKDAERVEPFGGFYSRSSDEKVTHQYYSHSVNTRFLTRVGINRRRATSEEEILYSIEVLNESFLENPKPKDKVKKWHDYVYRSSILVENLELADKITAFINRYSDTFRLGGSTSRGLGKVEMIAKQENYSPNTQARIAIFKETLQQRWQAYELVFGSRYENPLNTRSFFTIDFQSDAILSENWRCTTVVNEDMLNKFVKLTDESLKLEAAYSSYDYRSGWNSAWGLMKDMELVTNRGAVYLFSTNNLDLWLDKLLKLELLGIGERTSEGFGQVQICNEFHNVLRGNPA
ncbi:MAG: CRISPR-associated RAMP protein Csx10 [Methylacidiphilales bacterium]|nr:CRISPR-associated RAMP protein Csx10 [Candidatus Methylacidiphilales bacterium]NJR18368.1 CRISPR-associated RAMP protein Csx10 [Calothrix sp. CSU_2_0]